MQQLRSITSVDVKGKKILCRFDFNVPIADKEIKDDTRITRSLPTIKHLLSQGAYLILTSHLGRPKGKVIPEMTLSPVAKHLEVLLGQKVEFVPEILGDKAAGAVNKLGEEYNLVLLENTRFDAREKKNDPDFSKSLAEFADLFVSDAFGTVHRAHASTVGVSQFLPSYAGFLVQNEYQRINESMVSPSKPTVAIIGGAKVSTKLDIIINFLEIVDTIVIGGGMAYTFLKAQGMEIGSSLLEADMVSKANEIMEMAKSKLVRIILPKDVRIASDFDTPILENDVAKSVFSFEIPADAMGLDIGPQTEQEIIQEIEGANTIFWNGPLGVFEKDLYSIGTKAVAEAIINRAVNTIIGGGDTAYALNLAGLDIPEIIHVSTGGGASLELMSGLDLPGIECLKDK